MGEEAGQQPVVRVGLRRLGLADLVQADEALRGCPLLRPLDAGQRAQLLAGAVARRFADGAPVFQEGEPVRALYLVLQGEARVRCRRGAETLELAAVQRGDFFGEAELAAPALVRAQSAVAHGGLDVAEVPAAALREALEAVPGLQALLSATAEARQRAGNELSEFLNRW